MQHEPTPELVKSKPVIRRGIYLLPNLLTTVALFAGFYSIVAAMNGRLETAAIAIFISMIADTLDGRVARMTNTQSAFGAEYDSLSDMVAFGLAPSLILFHWSLSSLGKIGWAVAFFYTAATALRLARFNTQVSEKAYFTGLPCPTAAGILMSFVWLGSVYNVEGPRVAAVSCLLTVVAAILMVSQVRYYSFKQLDIKGRLPFFMAVVLVLLIVGVALQPPQVLFIVFSAYALMGPIATLMQLRRLHQERRREKDKRQLFRKRES